MLEIPDQATNKYFKVLYGPLDHAFHITLHNKPYKYIVLFDDNFRQIRKIDVSQVASFQSRCVQSDSTVNVLNRKQSVITKKYLIEIYFGSTNKYPLTFTTVSYIDCKLLSEEIENVFGVRVYNYGTLNTAFKNALKNVEEAEVVTEDHFEFRRKLDNYNLHRNAYELKNLYDFAQLNYEEHTEPLAEVTSNFPVVIEGNMEDGSFISYRDITTKNNLNSSVYKVEWYLSKSVGSSDEYFENASETSDTFYLSEYMIGHYVMVKVYRALKFNENRTFVFSTAQKGPIYPNTLLCHHILINSTKKPDLHEALISTLDLDVLFNVVDDSNKYGLYEPFNSIQVVSNFAHYQKYLQYSNTGSEKKETKSAVVTKNDSKVVLKENISNEVTKTQDSEVLDPNAVLIDNNKQNSGDHNSNNSSIDNDLHNNSEDNLHDTGEFNHNNIENASSYNDNKDSNGSNDVNNSSNEVEGVEPRTFTPNSIKLKVPSKTHDSKEFRDEEMEEENGRGMIDLKNLDENNVESLKFLYGENYAEKKVSKYKDLHETTTVSELSSSGEIGSFSADERFKEEPKKKRFSIFSIFRSRKKSNAANNPLNPKEVKSGGTKGNKMMKEKGRAPKARNSTGKFKDMSTKNDIKSLKQPLFNNTAKSNNGIGSKLDSKELNVQPLNSEEQSQDVVLESVKDMLKEDEANEVKSGVMHGTEPTRVNEDDYKRDVTTDRKISKKLIKDENKNQNPRKQQKGKKVVYNKKYEKQLKQKNAPGIKNGKMNMKNIENENLIGERSPKGVVNSRSGKKNITPEKANKPKRVIYDKKYEKQLKEKRASKMKNMKVKGAPTQYQQAYGEYDYTNTPKNREYGYDTYRGNRAKNTKNANIVTKSQKKGGGFFGLFKKSDKRAMNVEVNINQNSEVVEAKKQLAVNEENFKKFIDTMRFVPVELKICLNELVIRYGLSSLSLKWKLIDVEKSDQLVFDQFPSIQKQMENRITLVYKSSIPIRIGLRTQSTFQRNVLYHSIIFNKYRSNYSIDRCERELQNGYYNGVRIAYTKACRALYEHKKRNEVNDLKEEKESSNQMQLTVR